MEQKLLDLGSLLGTKHTPIRRLLGMMENEGYISKVDVAVVVEM